MVETGGAMCCAAAGGFEGGTGDEVKLKGGGGVNVRGITAEESGNEVIGVGDIAVVYGFPDSLGNGVYLGGVAGNAVDGFVV